MDGKDEYVNYPRVMDVMLRGVSAQHQVSIRGVAAKRWMDGKDRMRKLCTCHGRRAVWSAGAILGMISGVTA